MRVASAEQVGRIRHLNDLLRCKGLGGQVMVTAGIDALGQQAVMKILREVGAYTAFTKDNDPHSEHDCAMLEVDGHRVLFKIDYFDGTLTYHSPDAADPAVTSRVMTVMLAHEY